MISAFIIGRDQSLTLGVALRSLADADEVIYADAGSADGSCDLAADIGARVIRLDLSGGGSLRNRVAAMCAQPYALWLSPDEEIEAGGVDRLRAMIAPEVDAVSVTIREARFDHQHAFPRLFRASRRWVGRAHEYLEAAPPVASDIVITHHRGPWHDHPSDPLGVQKALLADIAEMPDNPRWLYYLARDYYERGEYAEAVVWFQRRIAMASGFLAETADAYLLLARCLWALNRGDEARSACALALVINANFGEAARFMAELSWPRNRGPWLAMAAGATNAGVLFVRG